MRNIYLLLIFSMFFANCSKNDIEQQLINKNTENVNRDFNTHLFQSNPSPESDAIKERIQNFQQRLQSAETESVDFREGNLTATEAEWNIEAMLNATYGRADIGFSKLDKSVTEFNIPISGGTISNNDLLASYETARTALANHYEQVNENDKQTLTIDIQLIEETANSAKYKQVSYIVSTPPPPPPTNCDVFDETDYWYWGWEQGLCSEVGGDEGIDAADVLAQELNFRYPLPNNHLYFTGIQSIEIFALEFPNPNDDVIGDDYRDYLFFVSLINNLPEHECISPEDMNWYYCNAYDVITDLMPTGKGFSHIDLFDDILLVGGNYPVVHNARLFCGSSVQCDCPPCPPNVPPADCPVCC